jgi:hypothetical protein
MLLLCQCILQHAQQCCTARSCIGCWRSVSCHAHAVKQMRHHLVEPTARNVCPLQGDVAPTHKHVACMQCTPAAHTAPQPCWTYATSKCPGNGTGSSTVLYNTVMHWLLAQRQLPRPCCETNAAPPCRTHRPQWLPSTRRLALTPPASMPHACSAPLLHALHLSHAEHTQPQNLPGMAQGSGDGVHPRHHTRAWCSRQPLCA